LLCINTKSSQAKKIAENFSIDHAMKTRLWLLLSLLASATMWFYMHRVLLPWEQFVNVSKGPVIAAMGDLYPRWVGTREYWLHGRNPYSPGVSHEIQMAYYGHPIVQSYDKPPADILDEQRFAYPVYLVFLLAPVTHVDFPTLQNFAPFLLGLGVAASILLWLDILHWRPPWPITAAICLFVLSSPQIVQGLRLRQLALLVGFLLALGAWCLSRNYFLSAGVVFAVSTIKPQMVILPLTCVAIWSIGDWRRRWRVLAGMGGTLVALVLAGEWIVPGWIGDFFQGMDAYRHYVPLASILRIFLGPITGTALSVIFVLLLIFFMWRNRKEQWTSARVLMIFSAFFLAAVLTLPLLSPLNQVMLVLPLLMVLRDWTSPSNSTLTRLARFVFVLSVSWPMIVSAVLLLFRPRTDSLSRLPLLPWFMVFVVPFVLLLLLATRGSIAIPTGVTDHE
jgi:Glycosyltransferase family 87